MSARAPSLSGSLYLPLLAAAAALPRVIDQIWPTRIPSYGAAVNALLTLILLCLAAVAWFRAPLRVPQDRATVAFLALFGVLWIWAAGTMAVRGELPVAQALVMLIVLGMVGTKAPTFSEARRAMAWTGVIMAVGVWVAWVLGQFGVLPSDWATHDNLLCRPLGPPPVVPFSATGTWGGPFGSGNILGQVGAYIAFFGVIQKGFVRWFLLVSGVYFVLISQSETSIVAFLAGLGVMGLFWILRTREQAVHEISVIGFFGIGGALIMGYLYINPTMSERTTGWAQLFGAWTQYPLLGVPQEVLAAGVEEFRLPWWAVVHAHNMWLDLLVRNGLMALVIAVPVYGVALWITSRAALRDMAVPAAVLASMLVSGLGEKVFSWGHGIRVNFLLLVIVLAASAWISERSGTSLRQDRQGRVPEAADG